MVAQHGLAGGAPEPPELSTSDWMLVLLGSDEGSPILGRTVFVKLLFVIGKELVPQIDSKFGFFPSRYGPYSDQFQPSLTKLVFSGLVQETEAPAAHIDLVGISRYDYYLLSPGLARANELLKRLPGVLTKRISEYKRALTSLGFWGLIHYVYTNYPEYTLASELEGKEGLRRLTGTSPQ